MTTYPTNLSDSQWQVISKYLDISRNRKYDLREIVNAILYVVKTGCQWGCKLPFLSTAAGKA